MDMYTHFVLALGSIGIAYLCGRWAINNKIGEVVISMIDTLEAEGFILTVLDKDGEKELIPISELIEKAVKESKKIK